MNFFVKKEKFNPKIWTKNFENSKYLTKGKGKAKIFTQVIHS